jgi:hypothetical protein
MGFAERRGGLAVAAEDAAVVEEDPVSQPGGTLIVTVSGARPSTSNGIFVTNPFRVGDIAFSGCRLTPTGPATTDSSRQSAGPCPMIALSQGATFESAVEPAIASPAARIAKKCICRA